VANQQAFISPAAQRRAMPIFIMGCHRSGTTLLRYILDTHPDIACPPESKFVNALIPFFRYPHAVQGLRTMGFGEEIGAQFSRLAGYFFGEYARRKGKRRWADKTPTYYRNIELVDWFFRSSALYVFIVRHPFDVIPSLQEMLQREVLWGQEDPGLVEMGLRWGVGAFGAARYWHEINQRLITFADIEPDRTHVVRYEDLVTRPREALDPMFEFLGESWDPALLDQVFSTRHDDGFGFRGMSERTAIDTTRLGKWTDWPERRRKALWKLVGDVAADLGYSADDPMPAAAPAR
jgi:protein-tyrosine sulfotransferase